MLPDDLGPAETAIQYADQFADAAVAKLDTLFGPGFAKANPAAFAAYVTACSGNLAGFMSAAATAAAFDMDAEIDEAIGYVEESRLEPRKPKGRRR
ncbi:MAG: hypothetical protein U1E59_14985 [Amaricoccus sp.]